MTTPLIKQTQEDAETTEMLLDAIESLHEGIAVYDSDHRLVTYNQRYLDMFPSVRELMVPGALFEDLLRAAAEAGHYSGAVGQVDEWLKKMIDSGLGFNRDLEIEQSDGSIFHVRYRPTSKGGFVLTRTDITERRRAEAMAQDREALLATVLDTTPVAVVMARIEDGKIIYRSKEAENTYGMTAHAHEHYLSAQDRTDYVEILLEQGRIDDYRLTQARSDGTRFEATMSGRIVEYGGELCAVSAIADLTEKLEKEALIRHVMEACPTPIQMTNAATGEVIFSSPETISLFGRVDSSKKFYADPEVRPKYLDLLRRNGSVSEFKAQFLNPKGEKFWGAVSARLIDYNGTEVIVSHTRDMTQHLKVEAELAAQQELLYQNEKMSALGELLAGVAHELNNPLSVVVGHSLMLREDSTDPEFQRQIEKISTAAERCAKIVKTFLTMARQKPAKTQDVNINEVVQIAVDVASYGDAGSGIQIEYDLDPSLPKIRADADQITQVIANLIINAEQAIRMTETGDKIIVRTRMALTADLIEIEIEDNGPGVAPANRGRIFEPFFTTKDVGDGTGIGLALSHRIIRSHNGQIMLDSNFNSGSRFRITLPANNKDKNTGQDDSRKSEEKKKTGHILIVDDEKDVAELNAEILTRDGFSVDVANTVREAILKMEQTAYDLLLSDLNMPEIDGRGFYEAVVKDFPHLKSRTGFVTGDTMGRASQKFLGEAGRPYLEKPVSPKELRAFVADILSQTGTAL